MSGIMAKPVGGTERFERATAQLDPPFAVVDLAAFDANATDLVRRAGGVPIRVVSKSLRCRHLIERVLARPGYRGVMCYSLAEALWLHAAGTSEDLLVAYPTADRGALRALAADESARRHVTVTIDSADHLDFIDATLGASHPPVRVCLDLDMSWRPLPYGPVVQVGTWRSPLRTPAEAAVFAAAILRRPGFVLVGVLGYEGQIAGLGDAPPGHPVRARIVRAMQARSAAELAERRGEAVRRIRALAALEFVNGGGTGSLESTAADKSVTELAAGSGLVGPTLFDSYRNFRPRPALQYALPVVRRPAPGIATLFSGGYVASGTGTPDRLPRPFRPSGLKLTKIEGAGEVQTPVLGPAADRLRVGDRVWLRHAKGGELAERLTDYHLIEPEADETTPVPTYRGEGQCFGLCSGNLRQILSFSCQRRQLRRDRVVAMDETIAPGTGATGTGTALPIALAEPTVPVRANWITLLFVANIGLWLAVYAPIQVLLPEQVASLHDHVAKNGVPSGADAVLLSVVMGVGAIAGLLANPVIGALSDRTTSPRGRRHPWTLGCAVVTAAGLAVVAAAPAVPAMAVGWFIAEAGLGGMLATLTAALPDRVPVRQRGTLGALIGISQMLGTVLGALIVTVLITRMTAGYAACAVIVVGAAAAFALRTPDEPLPSEHKPQVRLATALRQLWVSPRAHPDFGWGWLTHFLINLGNDLGTLYLLYFLAKSAHYHDPQTGLLLLMALYAVALLAAGSVFGTLSDRSGRRKPFIVGSAVVMAVAAAMLAASPTWGLALVAAPLLGAGYGTYWAAAPALLTQVLPAAAHRAKDLGLINIAYYLPLVVAPLLAGVLLGLMNSYSALFALAGVVTVTAAWTVGRVRSVP